MQCHYCDRSADLTVDKDGLKVGVCEEHFQAQLEEISDEETLDRLREHLEIERS